MHSQDKTLLDEFAMAAMAALLTHGLTDTPAEDIAKSAYMMADAMLAEKCNRQVGEAIENGDYIARPAAKHPFVTYDRKRTE